MRIAHLSDLHFGAALPHAVDALMRRIAAIRPDLVVMSGDFTMAARHREFDDAKAILDELPMPILAVPGNHDIPVYNLVERFFSPLDRYTRAVQPFAADRFVSRAAAILGLNTARPWELSFNWSHGRLSADQIDEADRFFDANADARFKALVVHHPFEVPADMPGFKAVRNSDAMVDVLAKHRVDLVMSGHLHRQFVTSRSVDRVHGCHTLHLLNAGSPTTHRHREHPNAFAVIDVVADGISIRDEVFDGERFVQESHETLAA